MNRDHVIRPREIVGIGVVLIRAARRHPVKPILSPRRLKITERPDLIRIMIDSPRRSPEREEMRITAEKNAKTKISFTSLYIAQFFDFISSNEFFGIITHN